MSQLAKQLGISPDNRIEGYPTIAEDVAQGGSLSLSDLEDELALEQELTEEAARRHPAIGDPSFDPGV
jgi:hypothetical protein